MVEPMISVIVPAYNIQDYLSSCLDSILAQTHWNLEVIVVDDGSTDKTGTVADVYAVKDSRICVIHQENSGVTAARFTGINAAEGEWISFVDGDDYIDPEMIERLLAAANDSGADISHCGYQKHYKYKTLVFKSNPAKRIQSGTEAVKDLLKGKIEPGLCNKLYRLDLVQNLAESKKVDFSIKNSEDLLMNYYLFQLAGLVVYVDFCPYHYIVRAGSATHPVFSDRKCRDPIIVWELLKNETEKDPELSNLCLKRLTEHLVRLVRISNNKEVELKVPIDKEACDLLENYLPEIKKNPEADGFLKMNAVWAVVSPKSYRKAYEVYLSIKEKTFQGRR